MEDTPADGLVVTGDSGIMPTDSVEGQGIGAIPTADGLIIYIPLELLRLFATEASEARRRTSQS